MQKLRTHVSPRFHPPIHQRLGLSFTVLTKPLASQSTSHAVLPVILPAGPSLASPITYKAAPRDCKRADCSRSYSSQGRPSMP